MRRLRVRADGEAHEVELAAGRVQVDGQRYPVRVEGEGPEFRVMVGKRSIAVHVGEHEVTVDGVPLEVEVEALPPGAVEQARHAAAKGPVFPPLPGRVVAVRVHAGQEVQAGQCLVVLDAMKMQNEVPAPAAGKVLEVRVREGQLVEAKDALVVLG